MKKREKKNCNNGKKRITVTNTFKYNNCKIDEASNVTNICRNVENVLRHLIC